MSARYCGCDPDASWQCAEFPNCEYGRERDFVNEVVKPLAEQLATPAPAVDYDTINHMEPKGVKPFMDVHLKGTDICADLYCVCGAEGHVDGYFFYFYECAACQRMFKVGANVRLYEVTDAASKTLLRGGDQVKTDPEPRRKTTDG